MKLYCNSDNNIKANDFVYMLISNSEYGTFTYRFLDKKEYSNDNERSEFINLLPKGSNEFLFCGYVDFEKGLNTNISLDINLETQQNQLNKHKEKMKKQKESLEEAMKKQNESLEDAMKKQKESMEQEIIKLKEQMSKQSEEINILLNKKENDGTKEEIVKVTMTTIIRLFFVILLLIILFSFKK